MTSAADLGSCIHGYCQDPAVVYAFGHSNRITVVRASDTRAQLLANLEPHRESGGRCLQHAHDALDQLIDGTFDGGPDVE
jgi:hypothetical protein